MAISAIDAEAALGGVAARAGRYRGGAEPRRPSGGLGESACRSFVLLPVLAHDVEGVDVHAERHDEEREAEGEGAPASAASRTRGRRSAG